MSGLKHRKKEEVSNKTSTPTVQVNQDTSTEERWMKWWIRTYSTLAMIGGFFLILWIDHLVVVLFILFLQVMVYREIVHLSYELVGDKIPRNSVHYYINWWWFFCVTFFIYGRIFLSRFPYLVYTLGALAHCHTFLSFAFYLGGFVTFVAVLKEGCYKEQFQQLSYTHLTLVIAITQSSLFVSNIFDGIFWFFLPCSLVVCNDVWAYIWGFFFGRKFIKTPLIKLSPNKTWEGFIGACLTTMLVSVLMAFLLSYMNWMICPRLHLFTAPTNCPTPDVFVTRTYHLPYFLTSILGLFGWSLNSIHIMPILIHAAVMGIFASLVAPFGGFFASGAKRSIGIKDFGNVIPGHGGVSDRMDCQIIMGAFAYVYYNTFVKTSNTIAEGIINQIQGLNNEEQLLIFKKLQENLSLSQ
eukprot:TRINITY_DN250_c0_g1_i1.p1 TRINITY_DN250_c0_g1~~TRINITY_DN250_c0_g1_i1.p1  ORF type:complete len:411 (+),score=15.21 TRINITY_DN250_c0_g1_i1:160-1392(+)